MHLADTKTGGRDNAAGKLALDNLKIGCVNVIDSQILRSGQYLIRCGRTDNGDAVPGGTMRLDQLPRLRIDKFRNGSAKESLAIGDVV